MSLLPVEIGRHEHPVDVVERLANINEWSFDRADEDEISISVEGGWASYHIAFTWLPELEALHVACAFDLKVPPRRHAEVLALIALINEQLWVGHFDLWSTDSVIMFRQALMLAGGAAPNHSQCEAALAHAVASCERYYQAFQFVVWAGKSAREALNGAMFETEGHA
ncbi:MAG: YbjN domain-containing protein [Hyphomicrobiales bacterium]|nr:YbjN domain-containing protein [Hyphomicrobiales bacterium]MDE2113470.1 YbjN domain-containing protein [Hyphomicrobiales bacterium]